MVNTFSNVRLFDVTLILTYNDSPNPCICRFDKTHTRYEFACLSNRPGRSSGERQSYALINTPSRSSDEKMTNPQAVMHPHVDYGLPAVAVL